MKEYLEGMTRSSAALFRPECGLLRIWFVRKNCVTCKGTVSLTKELCYAACCEGTVSLVKEVCHAANCEGAVSLAKEVCHRAYCEGTVVLPK